MAALSSFSGSVESTTSPVITTATSTSGLSATQTSSGRLTSTLVPATTTHQPGTTQFTSRQWIHSSATMVMASSMSELPMTSSQHVSSTTETMTSSAYVSTAGQQLTTVPRMLTTGTVLIPYCKDCALNINLISPWITW